jgi:adenosylhomocysteinase
MPLLAQLRDEYASERPLAGRRLGMCLHVEPKTAVLGEVLLAGGCELALTGSPATTDDGTAAFLAGFDGIAGGQRTPTTRLRTRPTSSGSSTGARTCCSTTAPT